MSLKKNEELRPLSNVYLKHLFSRDKVLLISRNKNRNYEAFIAGYEKVVKWLEKQLSKTKEPILC